MKRVLVTLATATALTAGLAAPATAATNTMDGNKCSFTFTDAEKKNHPLFVAESRTKAEAQIGSDSLALYLKANPWANEAQVSTAKSIKAAFDACVKGENYPISALPNGSSQPDLASSQDAQGSSNNSKDSKDSADSNNTAKTVGIVVGVLAAIAAVVAAVAPAIRPYISGNLNIRF